MRIAINNKNILDFSIKEIDKRYSIINWLIENTGLKKTTLNTSNFKELLKLYNSRVSPSQEIDINKYYTYKLKAAIENVNARIERDLKIKEQYEKELKELENGKQ